MITNHTPSTAALRRRAFTLIEILIVIGITAVLFALLLIPLVSALRYTRQAQAITAAQDAARITRERITRELGSAVYVFDNASHPFTLTGGGAFGPGEDSYTNFLDLEIPKQQTAPSTTTAPATTLAHAYSAKMDMVLPKINDAGSPVIDPTTHEPVTFRPGGGSAIISSPSLIFPTAAGTTVVRYFVGLRDPTRPYNNVREMKTNIQDDNTHILYRAQFQPYNIDPATGKLKYNTGSGTSNDGTSVNEDLLAPQGAYDGVTLKPTTPPELDDPDFFRFVTAGVDINWLSADHHVFTTDEAYGSAGGGTPQNPAQGSHNYRVNKWIQIAKPVIPGPNIDLLLMPHNTRGGLIYGTTAGANVVAGSGTVIDPVTGKVYPIVNTSVTFRPATVSGNATPSTTSDHNSQGAPALAGDTGAVFVPTVYTATNQSWAQPYLVNIVPPQSPGSQDNGGGFGYFTALAPQTYSDKTLNGPNKTLILAGDLLEMSRANASGTIVKPVYDITRGYPVYPANGGAVGYTHTAPNPTSSYIPLTINADSGTLNFATPALLDPANDPYSRQWVYKPTANQVDLKTNDSNGNVSPLGAIVDVEYPTSYVSASSMPALYTARIVPGSLRVYGPDATNGPGSGRPVLYTEAGNTTAAGDNQYTVDYVNSVLSFPGPTNQSQFAASPVPNPPPNITVLYDYQANMTPVGTLDSSSRMLPGYTLQSMAVTVDYQTRDLMDVSIGVRLYDVSSGVAQVVPSETKIKVGNSNR